VGKKLLDYLEEKQSEILGFINREKDITACFQPRHIYEAAFSYISRPAKRLRPAVLLLAAGCLGGPEKEKSALPAAAGVEVFHTWTLVHDDIIDNDSLRRHGPTVHVLMGEKGRSELNIDNDGEYGRDIAILTGDLQQGWAVSLFIDCALNMAIDPRVLLVIVRYLESQVLGSIICGETLDVQYSMMNRDVVLSEDDIVHMLWRKTGVLYEFAGWAGAMIGKETADIGDEDAKNIKEFTGNCGIAFQLQDDILGVKGDKETLGKPVGSDIREGKMTTIVLEALRNANEKQKATIKRVLGNRSASESDIEEVSRLLDSLNGIEHTKQLASAYLNKALPCLDKIAESEYKDLLLQWADYMIYRKY